MASGRGASLRAADPRVTVGEIGERALLRRVRARIPRGHGVVEGVGDDAAAVETGPLTLVTTDCMVEGVHFRRDWSLPPLLGRKALTVNLSDVAAMGGSARYATVSLCLPPDVPLAFVDGLYDGLLARAAECGVDIVGGNLAAIASAIVVDVALLGAAERLLRRSTAQAGDLVVVTGTLGAAAAGLRCLSDGARLSAEGALVTAGRAREHLPEHVQRCLCAQLDRAPPLAFARALAERDLARAAMDLSDGLSGDLLTLCEASAVSARLDAEKLPVDPHADALEKEAGRDGFALALHGGEDYELLMAVAPERFEALRELAASFSAAVSAVGEFAAGPPSVALRKGDTLRPLQPLSHDHFTDRRRQGRAEPSPEA